MLGLLIIASVLLVLIMRALWVGLFLAVVLASLFWRPHRWLTTTLRGRRSLAASLIVVAVLVTLLGPVVGISAFLIREAGGRRAVSAAGPERSVLMAQ